MPIFEISQENTFQSYRISDKTRAFSFLKIPAADL